jgi:uncharacterized protein YbjT (DUF2867 family)
VRAPVFYENVWALVAASLATDGVIRLPWGSAETVVPLVAGEDVARVAAGLLASPDVPPGTTYPVIGAVHTLGEMLAILSTVLGREVRYQEISDEAWRREALARDVNPHAVEHLSHLWQALRNASRRPGPAAFAVTETIERFGGAKPKTFEQFVREERSTFGPPLQTSTVP